MKRERCYDLEWRFNLKMLALNAIVNFEWEKVLQHRMTQLFHNASKVNRPRKTD